MVSCDKKLLVDSLSYAEKLFGELEGHYIERGNGRSCLLPYPSPTRDKSGFNMFCGDKSLIPELFPGHMSFTFVRNPWDKIVSNWAMFTQKKTRSAIFESMFGVPAAGVDFKAFLRFAAAKPNHHWDLQVNLFPCRDGKMEVGYIGRVESFREDFSRFFKGSGFEHEGFVENRTDRGSYADYYDSDSMRYVEKMYRKDIEAFHYEF